MKIRKCQNSTFRHFRKLSEISCWYLPKKERRFPIVSNKKQCVLYFWCLFKRFYDHRNVKISENNFMTLLMIFNDLVEKRKRKWVWRAFHKHREPVGHPLLRRLEDGKMMRLLFRAANNYPGSSIARKYPSRHGTWRSPSVMHGAGENHPKLIRCLPYKVNSYELHRMIRNLLSVSRRMLLI